LELRKLELFDPVAQEQHQVYEKQLEKDRIKNELSGLHWQRNDELS
jgi:hypothetical protein